MVRALVFVAICLLGIACGTDITRKDLDEPCTRDEQCLQGLACLAGVCLPEDEAEGDAEVSEAPEP